MTKSIAGIAIPDSKLANEAAELLHEYGDQLLWNHSHRVFLFGSLLGRQENQKYDPELLYVSAVFHDLGLTKHYRSPDKRFEVDGANAARSLLEQHALSVDRRDQMVTEAVAGEAALTEDDNAVYRLRVRLGLEQGPARQQGQPKGKEVSRIHPSQRVGQRKPQRDPVKNSEAS